MGTRLCGVAEVTKGLPLDLTQAAKSNEAGKYSNSKIQN